MTRGRRYGTDLFLEEDGYTTLAAAVSMLVVLSLLFVIASGIWSMSRSGDVQVAADTTALAGANVVSSYHTTATVLDAVVFSMGLAGLCVTGVGLVGLLIPGANAAASQTIDTGLRMLDARNDFAASASRGLERLEQALPFLVAANATRTCAAQGTSSTAYTGTALAVPLESASDFPALEGEQISTEGLSERAGALDEAADELAAAAERTAEAKEAAWVADCGRDGANMQERAGRLSSIAPGQNPDYESSITWDPNVALDRTRAYYAARLAAEAPEGAGAEAAADSAARQAFYRFALERFEDARVVEENGRVTSTVELLPRNTAEVRGTTLYTDAVWPSTYEDAGLTLHYGTGCPGATGARGPVLALSAIDGGGARECPVCRFSVGDVGKTPAASTSIDKGFEYHLREFTLALDEYVAARNHELELERRALEAAEGAGQAFEEALSVLEGKRPRIAPPGRYGTVAFVVAGEAAAPEALDNGFAPAADVAQRAAISGAVLAPDAATDDSNVLASFFSTFEARAGEGGVAGLVSDVMGLWGSLLSDYGDVAENLSSLTNSLLGGLESMGLGPVARWMGDCVDGAVSALDIEPVDLRSLKPVITDTANVLEHSDVSGITDVQELLRSLPLGSTDPAALMEALGYRVREELAQTTITLVEIPLPGGGSVPLTVRVRDLLGGGVGAG